MKIEELEKLIDNDYKLSEDFEEDEEITSRTYTKRDSEEWEDMYLVVEYNIITEEIVNIFIRNPVLSIGVDDNDFGYGEEGIFIGSEKITDVLIKYALEINKNPLMYKQDFLEKRLRNIKWALTELSPVLETLGFILQEINDQKCYLYWENTEVREQFWIETQELTGKLVTSLDDDDIEFTTDMDSGIIYEIFEEKFKEDT